LEAPRWADEIAGRGLAAVAIGFVLMAAMSGDVESSVAEASKTVALIFFDENIQTHL